MNRCLLFFVLLQAFSDIALCQDLTGSWQGYMSGEKLEVNIMMKKNELCGYTADYVLRQPSSHCKAYFRGWFDERRQAWVLVGTSFIENSGNHILMLLTLWKDVSDEKNSMHATIEAKSEASSLFNIGKDKIELKRIFPSPRKIPGVVFDCWPVIKKPVITRLPKNAIVKSAPKKLIPLAKVVKPTSKILPAKPMVKAPPRQAAPASGKLKTLNADSSRIVRVPPQSPITAAPDLAIRKVNERKNTTLSHIIVHEKNILLSLYDNGIVDNDSVSIFYNGKLLAWRQGLSEKALIINLSLDEQADHHEIVVYAENLGSIPPNTALIVVTSGNKRYELHSSSSLTENAVLVFDYTPDVH